MKAQTLTALNNVPPALLVIISTVLFIAGGALTTTYLTDTLGVFGAANFLLLISAPFLIAFSRPDIRKLKPKNIVYLLIFGICLYGIDVFFFAALERLQLGVVVTIGFCGPLLLSLLGSKSAKDIIWFTAAVLGLCLITPFTDFQESYSYLGYLFALAYAACLVAYIFLTKHLCKDLSGLQGLSLGIAIAAILTLPISLPRTIANIGDPKLILIGLAIGLIGLVIPYAMDYIAMNKLKVKTIGILSSSEPLIGGVIGLLLLGEGITWLQLIAFELIALASLGSSLDDAEASEDLQDIDSDVAVG